MGLRASKASVLGKKLVGLGLWVAGTIAACSDQPASVSTEQVARTTQALSSDQSRILGFESVAAGSSDWIASSGELSSSERRVEGSRALGIARGGNSEIVSARLSSLGNVADKITLDLLLPAEQPNPYWMGTLKLVIECPSQGLYYEGLTEHALQGRATDQFLRFEFPLSASTRTKLSTGSYSDLRFKILLNVPHGAGPWLLDRLSVTEPDPGSSGGAGTAGSGGGAAGGNASGASGSASAGDGESVTFRIVTPLGVEAHQVALGASSALRLNDGVAVQTPDGSDSASVSNASLNDGRTYLGVRASVEDLWSIGPVELRNDAVVWGDLTTGDRVSLEPGADIRGARSEDADLLPRNVISWSVRFPAQNGGSVSLEPDQLRSLDPGHFGALSLKSRSRLKLRRGTYTFVSGAIEPQAVLDIDNTSGPVLIYFKGDLIFRGSTERRSELDNILFGVGNLQTQIDGAWRGVLVASDTASFKSQSAPAFHEGSIYADTIVMHQWTPVRHRPFDRDKFCDSATPQECGPFCRCGEGERCDSSAECQTGLSCVSGSCRDCARGGCPGAPCDSSSDCQPNLICSGGTCRDACETNPQAPGCVREHCGNGVLDESETDVDCGGDCPGCDQGESCGAPDDCGAGLDCGTHNGGCFGLPRSKSVCWPAACQDGVSEGECGTPTSPCGENCACVTACDAAAENPNDVCPDDEVCTPRLGAAFGASTADVCLPAECPSNDPNLCGTSRKLCGPVCVCTSNCSQATCANPSDGCGGECPGVCVDCAQGCRHDVHCGPGSVCVERADGSSLCKPGSEVFQSTSEPSCGPGSACGEACPTCTPQCGGRECGTDPACGTSCGSCDAGSFCNAAGQCLPAGAQDAALLVPDGDGGYTPIDDLPQSETTPVGALRGQFSVSEHGTAQYTIPIEVPPGRAGIEPALTLMYGGNRANGDAGVGWRLEGLSTITRCPRTFALDGYSAPVRNDPSDLFCIDGKRLEALPGGVYGANGTQYRTLIDSFVKVVSFTVDGSGFQHDEFADVPRVARELQGPDGFIVWTKDGRILSYGRTRDALAFGRDGVRHAWLLNQVEDRAGNTMIIQYDNASVDLPPLLAHHAGSLIRPKRIAYTGHGDSRGDREVQLDYEGRPDVLVHFLQGGVPRVNVARLSRIRTLVKGAPVKNYRIEYGSGPQSQIERVHECAGDSDVLCKKPTTFDYVNESGFDDRMSTLSIIERGGQLDLNGDGATDSWEAQFVVDGVAANDTLNAAQIATDVVIAGASAALTSTTVVGGLVLNTWYNFFKGGFFGAFAEDPKVELKERVYIGSLARSLPTRGPEVTNVQYSFLSLGFAPSAQRMERNPG